MVNVKDLKGCIDCGTVYFEVVSPMECPNCNSDKCDEVTFD